MTSKRIISTLAGLFFLGSALAFGFLPDNEPSAVPSATRLKVQVKPVKSTALQRSIKLSGITRASRQAVLGFTEQARLSRRPVEVGDHVQKGEQIALLDVRRFDIAVALARAKKAELEAQLRQAKRDRRRFAQLHEENVVPVGDYERVSATAAGLEAALAAASAGVREAKRARQEAELKAPFAGTITAVHLEPGEWASPGLPVVELSGDGGVEVEVEVPENVIGQVHAGQPVDVVLPFAGHRKVTGRVASVAHAALASGQLFPLVVALDATANVISGMTAEVLLSIPTEPKILVPVDAVVNPGASQPSVFALSGDTVREVVVTLGPFAGDHVVVSGDLGVDEPVVISGHTALSDGKKVVVQ